jgi:hypothetical protein
MSLKCQAYRPVTRIKLVLMRQDGHAGRTPAGGAIHEHDLLACEAIVGKARKEASDRNAELEPRQRRAQTVMDAVPECGVAIGTARDIETIRIVELRGIAVCCADHDVKEVALANVLATDMSIVRFDLGVIAVRGAMTDNGPHEPLDLGQCFRALPGESSYITGIDLPVGGGLAQV